MLDAVAGRWVRSVGIPRGTPWAVRLNRSLGGDGQPTYTVETGFYENYPGSEVLYFDPSTRTLEVVS